MLDIANIGFATFVTQAALGIMIVASNFMFVSMLGEDGVNCLFGGVLSFSGDIFHQQCRGPVSPAHNKLQLRGEKPRACASGIAPVAPHQSIVRGWLFRLRCGSERRP